MDPMRISQLAEASGPPVSTLRYYDGAGLLPSGRTAAGYRTYAPEAVERLGFISAAKSHGLPLVEIAQLLKIHHPEAVGQGAGMAGSCVLVLVVGGCLWSRSFDVWPFRGRGAGCCSYARSV